jgi:hypothetical protein
MAAHALPVVANGLRTDHPIPGVPFVDDSHIPVDDADAVEAVGRRKGGGMWGRTDPCTEGWAAYTTDPVRPDLAWVVRWHPQHGRSVTLYRNDHGAGAFSDYTLTVPGSVLARSGGYWWDGRAWYRPARVWDRATESYVRREVPGAVAVTADQVLRRGGNPAQGAVLQVTDVDPSAAYERAWENDLALWSGGRADESLELGRCVVRVSAPELSGEELIGIAEMAALASIGASTLRSYITRGENNVPAPQAYVGGRPAWAREVGRDWVEQRQRDRDGLGAVLAATDPPSGTSHPVGVQDLWQRFAEVFSARLWDLPSWRKRWALRHRNRQSVEEVAHDLAWLVAADLRRIVPVSDLGLTVKYAILHDARAFLHRHDPEEADGPAAALLAELEDSQGWRSFSVKAQTTKCLDWLIRHDPPYAAHIIGELILQARTELGIPTKVTKNSISEALMHDGTLDEDTREEFLTRVFTPQD